MYRPLLSIMRRAWGIGLLAAFAAVAHAIPIRTNNTAAAVVAPDGFREVSSGVREDQPGSRTLVREDAAGEIGISIEPLPPSDEPAGDSLRQPPTWQQILSNNLDTVRIYSERWNDSDIEVMCAQSLSNGTSILTHIVDIPLRPSPVRVSVKSQAQRESEARAILKSMINRLDESGNPRATADAHAMIFKAALYILLVLLVVVFMARSRM